MNDFIRTMKKSLTVEKFGKETLFIVIDKCERLREMEVNLLPTFLRLNELTGSNICVVFISEIIFEKFRQGTGFREPFQMHFPDYSKTELLEIMCLDVPEQHPKEFYNGYCQLLLSVFYNVCRDLKELRHLVRDIVYMYHNLRAVYIFRLSYYNPLYQK
jgi:origin recognition complex subunit 5